MTFCMLGWSAEAKTSPSAPCWICAAREDDPAKLNLTIVRGWRFSKSAPIVVNAAFSEEGANTGRVPLGPDWLALTGPVGPHALATPKVTTMNNAAATRTRISTSARSQLDDHIRCLDHRHGANAGGEAELVGRLPRNQRHEPVRTRLNLDLRHDAVFDDAGHDARKVIARRSPDSGLRFQVRRGRRHEARQLAPIDNSLATGRPHRSQPATVGQTTNTVDANAEQLGNLADLVGSHCPRL